MVVLSRDEISGKTSRSPSSPVRKPSHPKILASPVGKRTGINDTGDSSRHFISLAKRGTPKKLHGNVESDETEVKSSVRSDGVASKVLLESSEEENLLSVCRRGRLPVVIVLEDFECFRSQILQDLITICG